MMTTTRPSTVIARALAPVLIGAALLFPAAAQPAPAPALRVEGAWVKASLAGTTTSAAYFTVHNAGKSPDRLVAVSTPAAARAQIHIMSMTGGMMRMAPAVGGLPVPAGGDLRLSPGGVHAMLTGVKTPLRAGQTVRLTLRFQHAGALAIDAPVRASGPMDGHMH